MIINHSKISIIYTYTLFWAQKVHKTRAKSPECLVLPLQSGSKVAISTTPFENTSIKTGPARRNSYRSKMVRCAKKPKKEKTPERYKYSTATSKKYILCRCKEFFSPHCTILQKLQGFDIILNVNILYLIWG